MNSIEKVFQNRDGLTAKEAKEEKQKLQREIFEALENGACYDEIEEILLDEGLEMDYVMDLL